MYQTKKLEEAFLKKPLNTTSAQALRAHQNKWKETLVKMAQKTIKSREIREQRTQDKKD